MNIMNKEDLVKMALDFTTNAEENYISSQEALSEKLIGMQMFEAPLCAVGSASDAMFSRLKEADAVGAHFLLPSEWLTGARSVITFFFPFTEAVRTSNDQNKKWPSDEWLHSRIEGQVFINHFILALQKKLLADGYESVIPSLDSRFWAKTEYNEATAHPEASFTSNWSERHVGFVCGLGTFGLSQGLITEKGIAGRLVSIITQLELPADSRKYTDRYEYCIRCGACIRKCPADAISLETGKSHPLCSAFLHGTQKKYAPRYGCGKCQCAVPCDKKIPARRRVLS